MSKLSTQWLARKAGMFDTYFSSAIRHMGHNKFASGINIMSLAIGLAVALIVMLFVRHELSYDQWIPNSENIYRFESRNTPNQWRVDLHRANLPASRPRTEEPIFRNRSRHTTALQHPFIAPAGPGVLRRHAICGAQLL